MADKFDAYDLLGIIVPGALLLGWAAYCFPEAAAGSPQVAFPEAFTFVLLTALAVFLGQIVQSLASLVEPVIHWTWRGRPSDVALRSGLKRYLPAETSRRIKRKLQEAIGRDSEDHSLFLYAMQQTDGRDVGRVRRFNSLYAYHRALLVLSAVGALMLGGAMIWGWAAVWRWQSKAAAAAAFVLLIWLVWYRAWQRACYYVREVLLTAERLLDDEKKGKE